MRDTTFRVPKEKAHRLGAWYKSAEVDGKPNLAHTLEVVDKGGEESGWVGDRASKVLSGGGTVEVPLEIKGGMVSTFNDYLRFLLMIRNFGELDGVRVLKKETVQQMICNHIPAACNGKKTVFVFDKPGVGYSCLGQIQAQHPKQDKGTCSGEYGWGGLAGPAWTIDPRSDLIVLSMTQTAFVLDHEEYLRYAARRAIHQHIYGSVAAPAKATSYSPECFDIVRPTGKVVKDESALDQEFEEEFRATQLTRSKTAKERAILPGARLDRHPSDEVEAELHGQKGSGSDAGIAQDSDTTPAAKRRKSTAIGTDMSPGSKRATHAQAATPQSSTPQAATPSTRLADPSKPEELLFSRVAIRPESESGNVAAAPPMKARVTAVEGDKVEVVTEGCWSTRNVKLGEFSVIDESQFGIPTVRPSDPTEFPAPPKPGASGRS
mmetsp:Transcript_65733/g.189508  ORF Transcript_65733/g.189508 Transcript_65733/m.189508 type:complete len:435 (+) Transcript_65733:134-1438(+)